MSDAERRWEQGIPHHPLSVELMAHMQKMDTAGEADLRTGGDGDKGETLMYLADSYFEKLGVFNDDGTIDLNARGTLEKALVGALRGCIQDHGPITADLLGSATKRVIGALKTFNRQRYTAAKERHTNRDRNSSENDDICPECDRYKHGGLCPDCDCCWVCGHPLENSEKRAGRCNNCGEELAHSEETG